MCTNWKRRTFLLKVHLKHRRIPSLYTTYSAQSHLVAVRNPPIKERTEREKEKKKGRNRENLARGPFNSSRKQNDKARSARARRKEFLKERGRKRWQQQRPDYKGGVGRGENEKKARKRRTPILARVLSSTCHTWHLRLSETSTFLTRAREPCLGAPARKFASGRVGLPGIFRQFCSVLPLIR